jgi:hypothetical protein
VIDADQLNLREQVVNDMLLNGTVENVLANKAELAVNSSESTLNVGPAFSGIMGELSVMVLEVSDSD